MARTINIRALVALGAVATVQASFSAHTFIADLPDGYSIAATPSDSTVSSFTLALTLQNIDQLEALLLSVSTPGSAQYGQFLDETEIASTFGPSAESVSAVTTWLEASGITEYAVDGAFVDFNTTISTANSLLNASYQFFANSEVTKLRTLSLTLPSTIESLVALVEPGNYFGSTKATYPLIWPTPHKRSNASSSCETIITPDCLKSMYDIGSYVPDPDSGSWIGFGSWLGQSAIYSDLFAFEEGFGIDHQNFSTVLIANATNHQHIPTASYGEADLDVQNILGITHPMPVVEFITGGNPPFVPDYDGLWKDPNEPYVPFYRYLLSLPSSELPQVISQSYADFEYTVPLDYAELSCTLAGLLGLRGVSVLAGSGDWGVGLGCILPDNQTLAFEPIFPATCPYVTSVGGTVAVSPEQAWNGSSGGFSNYFARPAWQEAAVTAYLATVDDDTKAYYGQYTNWSGRGFPDIAAHSLAPDYRIYAGGAWTTSGGTSAATPVVAGIVALLNDARFRAGKLTPLGWLNPLIYMFGSELFTDITEGYSVGCDGYDTQSPSAVLPAGYGVIPGARWNATEGWDPTTGFGTPSFEKLKALVLTL